jgi:acyl-CoA reductase-like NAD-dependent aldehyde dehydrogenase
MRARLDLYLRYRRGAMMLAAMAIDSLIGTEPLPILIGGERAWASSGGLIESINPANGEVIARFPRCEGADVDAAVRSAEEALPAWAAAAPGERAAALYRLADVIEARAEQLAAIDVADNGSPIREMRNDSRISAEWIRYQANLAMSVRGETIPVAHDRLDYTLRQPFGVVGRIVPFNHPLMFATSKIAAPLIAGNTVIIKPSEHTSLSILALVDELAEIFPRGVVNLVTGYGGEAGDALVAHPRVRRLAFTGHADTGRAIQRRAAEVAVKTVTLELGGKNPIVIFPDADLESAIVGALRGMNFTWQGQSCGSTSRLVVHEAIHEELVEALAERMEGLRSGMPDREETETGAIVTAQQLDKVRYYIEVGHGEGAKLVAGGGPPEDPELAAGNFMRPTLFDDVDPDGRLAQEEIFGPVLAAMTFRDYEDAIRIANRARFGLTASVFTSDLRTAHRFARDVEAGYVWVNDSSRHFTGTPFGGFKDSGIGREEDLEELLSYTQVKNVNVLLA